MADASDDDFQRLLDAHGEQAAPASDSDIRRQYEALGGEPAPVPESEIARRWLQPTEDEIRRQLEGLHRRGAAVPAQAHQGRIARDFLQSPDYDRLTDYWVNSGPRTRKRRLPDLRSRLAMDRHRPNSLQHRRTCPLRPKIRSRPLLISALRFAVYARRS